MDPFIAATIAVLGIATGVFASHATLGNKVTRALTLLEGLADLPDRVRSLEATPHYHRRTTDGIS